MTLQEAIEARHSVRAYKNEPLAEDACRQLEEEIAEVNQRGRLHIQLIQDEPSGFTAERLTCSTVLILWLVPCVSP